MARYVTPTEYQRLMRQRQQEIDRYNRAVDAHNRDLQRKRQEYIRAVNDHNRKVESHNREIVRRHNQVVDARNREVRAHSAQVNAYRQQLSTFFNSLNTAVASTQYVSLRTSAFGLKNAYENLEQSVGQEDSDHNDELLLGLPSREAANSLRVVNALVKEHVGEINIDELRTSPIANRLRSVSPDFGSRWEGAIFALHPQNPDGARHFCTSAREVITGLLDVLAPDDHVIRSTLTPQLTDRGTPTRRSKVHYLLGQKSSALSSLNSFVVADVDNIVELFTVFNGATHGVAGRYEWHALQAIKTRVEDGINFLMSLAGR